MVAGREVLYQYNVPKFIRSRTTLEKGSCLSFQAYFYAETPDKQKLFGRITGKNYPLQFGRYFFKEKTLDKVFAHHKYSRREVMANEKLLNMSSRVDWKVDSCI